MKKQTKQEINNRCTNELNIQLISQIKNGGIKAAIKYSIML